MRIAVKAPDGVIENIVVAESFDDVSPPEGRTLVEDTGSAEIGGTHSDTTGFSPAPKPPPPPPPEDPPHIKAIKRLAAATDTDISDLNL